MYKLLRTFSKVHTVFMYEIQHLSIKNKKNIHNKDFFLQVVYAQLAIFRGDAAE